MAGASNDSGVVDDSIFGDLSGYFFGNFRDKASNIILYFLKHSAVSGNINHL